MAKKESVRSEYEDIIKAVMDMVYYEHEHPRLVDFELAVASYKTQKEMMYDFPYTKRGVHTQVYRAMKALEKRGVIIHMGRYYYPTHLYGFYSGLEDFKKNVKLAKDTVAIISSSTYAIALEPGQDIQRVKESVTSFFREEKVFKLLYIDDTLIIIVNDYSDTRYIAYLVDIVRQTYRFQHPDEA